MNEKLEGVLVAVKVIYGAISGLAAEDQMLAINLVSSFITQERQREIYEEQKAQAQNQAGLLGGGFGRQI